MNDAILAYIQGRKLALVELEKAIMEPVAPQLSSPATTVVDVSLLTMITEDRAEIKRLKEAAVSNAARMELISKAVIDLGDRQNLEWVEELQKWEEKTV